MSHIDILNVDILSIDTNIKQMFKDEEEKIPEYKTQILELKKTKEENLSFRVIKDITNNILNLEKKIDNLSYNKQINFYNNETAYLLNKYKTIIQTPIKLTFLGIPTQINKDKKNISLKYLKIAEKYIDINYNILPKTLNKVVCNNCDNKKIFDIIDNSIYICLNCGSQQEIILHTSCYKDIDRINISAKYTYDRKVHFKDCINQYQGKQNSTIDKQVFKGLMDQFEKHYILLGNKKTPKEIRCKNITKEHIHIFLKELKYTKHYENVNLIHYQITGIKPDDISYIEDKLLDDFDTLNLLYDKKFKNKIGFDRKNFINTQYVLYQLLLKYKHPCKKEDFTILKTVDRKSFHDDVAKQIFEDLGWNHSPIF